MDERIIVSLPGKSLSDSKDYFPEDVVEYFGVRPDQVVDYKALVGDKSDNIPGVAGIGEKTAASLLQTYETLDGVYAHLDELSAGVKKKLEAGREAAYLSRKLARSSPIWISRSIWSRRAPKPSIRQQVEALFRELEFRTLMARLTALEKIYWQAATRKRRAALPLSVRLAAPAQQADDAALPRL